MAATENIKLHKTNQANFTVDQGYFYTFDYSQDNLLQKTDDGNTSFSYPLDTLLAYPIKDSEFDGIYFWSQEDPGGGDNMIIRQWKIDNYLCKLQNTFTFSESGSHKYDSEAFSIEHYHTALTSLTTSGSSTIYLDDYSDHASMTFTTTSGNPLILHLGPNSNGEEEGVEVDTVIAGGVTLVSPTQYDYDEGDAVNYYTYIWMFNEYNGIDSNSGALYKFDAYTGDYITKYASGAYKAVKAATFYKVNSFVEYGEVDTLCYVKNTNLLFINAGEAGATLPYYGSMVMENVKSDESTIIPIYDIAMDNQNIYRLQDIPDGTATTWSYYSYLLSSLDSFVTSISLAAYPAIIAANLVSTSDVVAIVKDQFLQPVVGRLVTFTDDNTNGIIIGSPDNTDADGKAEVTYRSGDDAAEVKITAVVEQT